MALAQGPTVHKYICSHYILLFILPASTAGLSILRTWLGPPRGEGIYSPQVFIRS